MGNADGLILVLLTVCFNSLLDNVAKGNIKSLEKGSDNLSVLVINVLSVLLISL